MSSGLMGIYSRICEVFARVHRKSIHGQCRRRAVGKNTRDNHQANTSRGDGQRRSAMPTAAQDARYEA